MVTDASLVMTGEVQHAGLVLEERVAALIGGGDPLGGHGLDKLVTPIAALGHGGTVTL